MNIFQAFFFFLLVTFILVPRFKKPEWETSSSPAWEARCSSQIAAATVWHSSVIIANSEFFLWKASFHSETFTFGKWEACSNRKWLLAWKWNSLRRRIEEICKVGRFSNKVVTFSKTRSSALLNYWVLSSSFPPKLKCRRRCWNPVLIRGGGYFVLLSSVTYRNWCDLCLRVKQSPRNDPELWNIYMNYYNKKFWYFHEINLKSVLPRKLNMNWKSSSVWWLTCNAMLNPNTYT